MKYLIIINPNSGKKKSIDMFNSFVVPKLKEKNHSFEYKITKYQHHAEEIANNAILNDKDGIIVLGGDGTMHEVVNGLLKRMVNKNIPIGILPAGSGNSLLYDLGKFNLETTLNNILSHNIRSMDVLKVTNNDRIYYSINLVGWGMGTDIGLLAEKMRWIGPARYNIASIIKIFTYQAKHATVIIDGNKLNQKFAFIIVCNTMHIGKGMKMAPNAKIDDGKIDVILIGDNFGKLELLKLFPSIFSGNHIKNHKVNYLQANSLELIPQQDEVLNIDGELIGKTPIHISVLQKKIQLLN